jgi:hypothetical protein
LLLLRPAGTGDVLMRGAAVAAAWTAAAAASVAAVTYAATAGVTIGHEDHPVAAAPSPVAASGEPGVPGEQQRATLSGSLTLDGAPLESQFLGVRVVRDGLATACQASIPAVAAGRYEIGVVADAEVRGCGAQGAAIVLWAYAGDRYIYSAQTAPWPGDGLEATFDATFSSAEPDGATTPMAGFKGELFDADGARLPAGTVVEAYVGETRCGVTSLRYGGATENLYTLYVAGPDSVPGCTAGATLTFRLNGSPAVQTAINDPDRDDRGELDLALR